PVAQEAVGAPSGLDTEGHRRAGAGDSPRAEVTACDEHGSPSERRRPRSILPAPCATLRRTRETSREGDDGSAPAQNVRHRRSRGQHHPRLGTLAPQSASGERAHQGGAELDAGASRSGSERRKVRRSPPLYRRTLPMASRSRYLGRMPRTTALLTLTFLGLL